MTTFHLVVLALILWCSFYGVYFNFLRPVLLTRFRFYINEVRDELDLLVLARKIKPTDEAKEILLCRASSLEKSIEDLNVTNILLESSHGNLRPRHQIEEEEGIISLSRDEVRRLSRKMDMAALGAFCANSPFLLGLGAVIICGVAVWSAVARSMQEKLTIRVWDSLSLRDWSRDSSSGSGAFA